LTGCSRETADGWPHPALPVNYSHLPAGKRFGLLLGEPFTVFIL